MVGSKPNPYLTEEARLEAQRRMLAERYGLLSDDSDDPDDEGQQPSSPPVSTPDPVSSTSIPANGISNGNPDDQHHQNDANGRNHDIHPHPSVSDDPAPSEAATYGEGSSVHDSDLAIVMTPDNATSNSPSSTIPNDPPANTSPKTQPNDRSVGWPGVELIDPTHGNRVLARYQYDVGKDKEGVVARDLRVTQIASYTSQLIENHDRKIAVNDRIIAYAVGGHIRAILRNSGVRDLLKGHGSAVADIEFLSAHERRLEPDSGDSISILGSVADDGSAYVWKLIRNDDGEEDTLTVSDAIRFEHPDMKDGRSYKKIAFRPGPNSIIAEKGIGVAMILVDGKSPDVRVVELVKMNDKMMVRDKFLRAQNEKSDMREAIDSTPVDSAAWMSERIVATSRGGRVHLWNADSTLSTCICRLPREKSTRVTSLHAFRQEALLLVVEHGRELELWAVTGYTPDVNSTTLELRQTIRITEENPSDLFAVSSVDPHEELVILSTVKGHSLFMLHYNRVAQAFDTLTEVPVKSPVISFCMTRNMRRSDSGNNLSSQVVDAGPAEEIGIWCVQPRVIQVLHLPPKDCIPRSFVKPEVYPRSILKSIPRKLEKVLPGASMASTLHKPLPHLGTGGSSTHSTSRKQMSPTSEPLAKSQSRSGSVVSPPNTVQSRPAGQPQASQNSPVRVMPDDSKLKSVLTTSGQPHPVPSTHVQALPNPPPPAEPTPSADEIAKSIIEAARKAVEAFEQGAAQRSASEKSKMDRLIDSVTETASSNLERFVNSTMKRTLAETLIPGMSQIMADASSALKENAKVDPKVTEEYFAVALEEANVNKAFGNACLEMERQMSASVAQSLTTKYEALVSPAVNVVNEAAEDVTASIDLLRSKISEMKAADVSRKGIQELEEEDVRKVIEEEIEQGNVDGAFQAALDKEDLALVTWLCGKFEAATFFETHTLSQDSIISLAQQLGQGLPYDDVGQKVEWLRELMLVLEPDADGYDAIAEQTMKQLSENVKDLRMNKEVLMQYDGLEKSLKTLSRLVTSHVQNI